MSGIYVLIIAILALDVWLLANRRNRAKLPPDQFGVCWSIGDVFLVAQFIVAAVVLFQLQLAPTQHVTVGADRLSPRILQAIVASTLVQNTLMIALPWFIIRRRRMEPAMALGLSPLPSAPEAWRAVKWGFATLVVGLGILLIATHLLQLILGEDQLQRLMALNRQKGNASIIEAAIRHPNTRWTIVITTCIFAPIAEEVLFRGFLFGAVRRRWNNTIALTVTSIIFALIHQGPLLILAILPVGILFGWARIKTGTLWAPIIMHSVNNTLQIIVELMRVSVS